MRYRVSVDDNFHYMDESERHEAGTYATCEEAIEVAKEIVINSLQWEFSQCEHGTPEELYDRYTSFGEDPFVYPNGKFSAWRYAKAKCATICSGESIPPGPIAMAREARRARVDRREAIIRWVVIAVVTVGAVWHYVWG